MNVTIVGSREYRHPELVERWVRSLAARDPKARVLSGGARNVDRTAERTAAACGLAWQSYRPHELDDGSFTVSVIVDGAKVCEYGRFDSFTDAAKARNVLAVVNAGADGKVVAFWDGLSTGTQHAMSVARGLRDLFVYGPDGRLDRILSCTLEPAAGVST